MNKEEFYNLLEKDLKIFLTDDQKKQLNSFANILIDYNKHTNITAITDINDIYLKHFYDSLTLVNVIDLSKKMSVLDVGSGGGFPGIVLAVMYPNLNITLLDSNNKKSRFQELVVQKLSLSNVVVINDRAENFFKISKKFDLVVARAVANMSILAELCIPFVNINGYFIAMKGKDNLELKESEQAVEFLGGKIENKVSIKLPITNDDRTLVTIIKIKNTPVGYPRVYDKILKKPLKNIQK